MVQYFTDNDKIQFIESGFDILNDYLFINPLSVQKPGFHENLIIHLYLVFKEQLINYISDNNIPKKEGIIFIKACIKESVNLFYKKTIPMRSYKTSYIRKDIDMEKMKKKIEIIKNTPQPDQRTNEWYLFRWNLLTASSIWQAFDSESNQNRLIYNKCKPIDLAKYNSVNINSPLHWGQKYEPLSVMLYEKYYNTTVEDFGCIKHPNYDFIGASPDGIITDEKSLRYGRMLEIKNVVSRKITGIPKYEYWIQMQMQMETCNLNECDFLETAFKEYDTEEDYMNDGCGQYTEKGEKKGKFLMFFKDGKPHYEYPELNLTSELYNQWEKNTIEELSNKGYIFTQYNYWYLECVSCVLVLRNKLWFKYAVPVLDRIWKKIIHDRKNGYEHRAPKSRKPKKKKCLINVKKLLANTEPDVEPKFENNNKTMNYIIETPPLIANLNIKDILDIKI